MSTLPRKATRANGGSRTTITGITQNSDDLPFGVSWHTAKNYTDGLNANQWAVKNVKGILVARTIEIPFAYSNGAQVYPDKMRQFGHGVARALKALAEGEE